ncbi:hypothetical protein [Hymenobacter sp. CRA2]|uniref:hypothetical protein n=1 Tax=Hymenobacter sp. CRA2 TaxID=1955620 RepID=UPI00098FED76|nr:hypothetical protein [Hymenobacter sp. CRA2]OON68801.1 hypothetical protein B0919_11495 [Hymenobacter sp. CRA2]
MKLFAAASFKSWFFALSCAALFAGCCGSVGCNCQDYRADALFFRFSADSLTKGFRANEVDTVLIVRSVYPRRAITSPGPPPVYAKPDTARIIRPRGTALSTPIVIDNNEPFAAVNGRKLGAVNADSSYRYTILLPSRGPGRRPLSLPSYLVDQVGLDGKQEADGCCTCYRNTRKSFRVKPLSNSTQAEQSVDATGQTQAAAFVLTR